MNIDFKKDLAEYYRFALTRWGCSFNPNDSIQQLGISFYNSIKRRIAPVPRNILFADTFQLPQNDYERTGFEALKNRMARGDDLTPHLHKSIKKPETRDNLLIHWGIHHFHLGKNVESSGFVERTTSVLCARVTSDTVFCLATMTHEQLREAKWAKQELFETIHRNWPDSICCFRMNGILPGKKLTDLEVGNHWDAPASVVVTVKDGTVYLPFGLGVVLSGDSIDVLRRSGDALWIIGKWEEDIRKQEEVIKSDIRNLTGEIVHDLSFKLIIDRGNVFALETNSSVKFELGKI